MLPFVKEKIELLENNDFWKNNPVGIYRQLVNELIASYKELDDLLTVVLEKED